MWISHPFFKYASGIILILLIILLFYFDLPVFQFIIRFIAAISLPIFFSVLLYYILRPLVGTLGRWMPKYLSILFVYLLLALVIIFFAMYLAPELIGAMSKISPTSLDSAKEHLYHFLNILNEHFPFINLSSFETILSQNFQKINNVIYQFLVEIVSALTGLSIAIALTPFILYYILRDDYLFSLFIVRYTPQTHQEEVQKILHDIDTALNGFITTQATVALVIGSFLLIGYIIIGLPYALLLSLFATIFYVIPFLGTFIAIIPALLIAATIHFSMILKVILIMIIAHFFETYLISPRLMSNTLKIHPLTIICLLLIGGSVFGIIGLILITPAYSIIKVVVWNMYKIFRLRYEQAKLQDTLKNVEAEKG